MTKTDTTEDLRAVLRDLSPEAKQRLRQGLHAVIVQLVDAQIAIDELVELPDAPCRRP